MACHDGCPVHLSLAPTRAVRACIKTFSNGSERWVATPVRHTWRRLHAHNAAADLLTDGASIVVVSCKVVSCKVVCAKNRVMGFGFAAQAKFDVAWSVVTCLLFVVCAVNFSRVKSQLAVSLSALDTNTQAGLCHSNMHSDVDYGMPKARTHSSTRVMCSSAI
jgi:hypothetical protein